MEKIRAAIIGSGNIGCDLMMKLKKNPHFDLRLLTGIDPASKGLALADSMGIKVSAKGIDPVLETDEIQVAFEATSAAVHKEHAPLLREKGITAIDLTPANVGRYVVPSVNLDEVKNEMNLNMVTCGGQATVPMVYAVSRVTSVKYAEIVSCISSESAGMGTRENIDEFTETTADALVKVGRADAAKAIIILNPAVPPILMTNTIYVTVDESSEKAIFQSCQEMLAVLQSYVPGYHFRVPPIIDGQKVTMVIEVEGAGDYLPKYSGNLDIITAAAVATAEKLFLQH